MSSQGLSDQDQVRITRLKTRDECDQFIKNVEGTRPDLAQAARRRAVDLQVAADDAATSPVLRDIRGALYAYEEVLFLKHGKRLRANHTRRAFGNHGDIGAVERIVLKPDSEGLANMEAASMFDWTFEAVVARNSEHFSEAANAAARAKLEQWANRPEHPLVVETDGDSV
jgi:hypothetical protein